MKKRSLEKTKFPGTKKAPCFIIAEAGVNHCGRFDLAKQLIEAAAASGADAIKFQTWVTEKLVLEDAALATYQRRNQPAAKSQYQMLKELELNRSDYRKLAAFAKRCGILFLSTPDEEDSADFLEKLGVSIFKIGSGEISNLPFLAHIAKKNHPVILSTGMSTLGEVEAAVNAVEATGNHQLTLLHCVSEYPAEPSDCNLSAMRTLQVAFGHPVGFSDHTLGTSVAIAAVALGACVIEKHLTLDKRMRGPDHKASLTPSEFAAFVRNLREAESALGTGRKRPTAAEMETKKVVQKSIVTTRVIAAGKTIRQNDLTLRRSSAGLPVSAMNLVLGRRTARSLPKLSPIGLADLA